MDHNITRPPNFDKSPEDDGPQTDPVLRNPGQPDADALVLYRCTCGQQLQLDSNVGGICSGCHQAVSPKMLCHDLALTMTINIDRANEIIDEGLFAKKDAKTVGLGETQHDSGPVPADDPSLLIGRSYGHFEIVATLGRGGMGQVYRGLDKSLQRYVAVKVLRSGIGSTKMSTSSEKEVDSLLQEAVAQARVTHPNIVTIYYVGKQDGDPFLAMELVNGNPLSKLISSGELTFSHITPIALQIVNALKFSYELDIIHGDIKPSNILVQTNGLTKLSDFGMARRASDDGDGRLGGTPNYIAPELLTGDKPSIQSDMYALGVTLYEMTFGRLPVTLAGTTVREWIDSHEGTEVIFPNPWPENFPESWRDVLVRLLAKKPSDRYPDYDELIADLENVRPGSRVPARAIPRMIAAVIDWSLILLLLAPISIVFALISQAFSANAFVEMILHFADLIPLALYSAMLYFWRQSPGRSLMHIRVVNQYGLIMSGKGLAIRDVVRNFPLWFSVFATITGNFDIFWIGAILSVFGVLVVVFWLLDTAFMTFYDHGRSLHDIIFKTRVVLDTESK